MKLKHFLQPLAPPFSAEQVHIIRGEVGNIWIFSSSAYQPAAVQVLRQYHPSASVKSSGWAWKPNG
jgi:hypothetical protein